MENKLNELLEFLAKDEEEAIKGYDDVIAKLDPNSSIVAQLKHIRDEEQAHLDFLREAQTNPDAKYEDYEHEDENEEVEEAEKIFDMKFRKE